MDKLLQSYEWEHRDTGIYTARTAIVDVSTGRPNLQKVWRSIGSAANIKPSAKYQDFPNVDISLVGARWANNRILRSQILSSRQLEGSLLESRNL